MSPSTDHEQTSLDQLKNADNSAVDRPQETAVFLVGAIVHALLAVKDAIREASLNDTGDPR